MRRCCRLVEEVKHSLPKVSIPSHGLTAFHRLLWWNPCLIITRFEIYATQYADITLIAQLGSPQEDCSYMCMHDLNKNGHALDAGQQLAREHVVQARLMCGTTPIQQPAAIHTCIPDRFLMTR